MKMRMRMDDDLRDRDDLSDRDVLVMFMPIIIIILAVMGYNMGMG